MKSVARLRDDSGSLPEFGYDRHALRCVGRELARGYEFTLLEPLPPRLQALVEQLAVAVERTERGSRG